MNENYYVAAITLAVLLLGHAIYIGYRMGQLTQALEDVIRRMVSAEELTKKIFQIDDIMRRLDRMDKLLDNQKRGYDEGNA